MFDLSKICAIIVATIRRMNMLKSLSIKNVALIDEVGVEFGEGFNVFTGETGAGKSILIGAIGLLLGDKADKVIIKEGKDFAKVEGLFDITGNSAVANLGKELGMEFDDDLILSRIFHSNGKSDYRINGSLTTQSIFKQISNSLIDIFGQHDNQQLLDNNNHIDYFDNYIGEEIKLKKAKLKSLLDELGAINKSINSIGSDETQRIRELELLTYEIQQIDNAELKINEEDDLLAKRRVMVNGERLFNIIGDITTKCNNLDVSTFVKEASSKLGSIAGIDESIDNCRDRLQNLRWEIDDIFETLGCYMSTINYSESDLEQIDARLDLINDLKRKYGNSISAILDYADNARQRVDVLNNCDEKLSILREQKNEYLLKIQKICSELHAIRLSYIHQFETRITDELVELGMKSAKFVVSDQYDDSLDKLEHCVTHKGVDGIEFLFSANAGLEPKPLSKIISGGELSRVALSFKVVNNNIENNKTIIFDEIDTGIGGNTGSVVGKKLAKISCNNQLLCITHLAQIASFADKHFKIAKCEKGLVTYTSINTLNDTDRIVEVGRMIGSIDVNDFANLHSKNLLQDAYAYKNLLMQVS